MSCLTLDSYLKPGFDPERKREKMQEKALMCLRMSQSVSRWEIYHDGRNSRSQWKSFVTVLLVLCRPKQLQHRLRLHQFPRLVQVVIHHHRRIDAQGVVNRRQNLCRVHGEIHW